MIIDIYSHTFNLQTEGIRSQITHYTFIIYLKNWDLILRNYLSRRKIQLPFK